MAKSLHMFMLIPIPFIILFVLYFLPCTLAFKISSSNRSLSHNNECLILLQFKDNMSLNHSASSNPGAYSKVASWKLNMSEGKDDVCCLWDGVYCNGEMSTRHVVGLDLSSSFLYGPINCNNTLFNLVHLRMLNLADNDFHHSQIPSGIGHLPLLTHLNLSSSNFSSQVPKEISQCTKLVSLDLSDCRLRGEFPPTIFHLQMLQLLDLRFNSNLTGYLPEFHGYSQLKYLLLDGTNFSGKLPASIGKLKHLNHLSLASCSFSGPLPCSVSNLTQLEYLNVYNNSFCGRIPSLASLSRLRYLLVSYNMFNDLNLANWLGKLPYLSVLALASNNLSFQIPPSIGNQTQLIQLDLHSSGMVGQIPSFLMNLTHLSDLDLSDNQFTGFEQYWPVLPWVGLEILDLSHNMLQGSIPIPPPTILAFDFSCNELSGEIPLSICELQSLQAFDLSFNNITGSIPACMEKIISNKSLAMSLRSNSLRGAIPNIFTNGVNLHLIDLSENQFEGQLPRSLENCASLQALDLGYNHIEDVFPLWLGALSELQVLILMSNKFHGTIRTPASEANSKFPKLHIIDLSYNSFFGDLPQHYFLEWSAMKETEAIAAYMGTTFNWSLVGAIHRYYMVYSMHMYNKGVMTAYHKISNIFMAVDLSSNRFGGKIPESIKGLSSLQLLNLSNNELSGVIPSSMGNMTQLESLDLSGNKLSGKIPQELVQLHFLEYLNLSCNNLVGPIPQGGQFNTFLDISYIGNPELCGGPLSKKCRNSKASERPTVSYDEGHDFPSGVDWVVILSGFGGGLVIGLLFGNHLITICYQWFLKGFQK